MIKQSCRRTRDIRTTKRRRTQNLTSVRHLGKWKWMLKEGRGGEAKKIFAYKKKHSGAKNDRLQLTTSASSVKNIWQITLIQKKKFILSRNREPNKHIWLSNQKRCYETSRLSNQTACYITNVLGIISITWFDHELGNFCENTTSTS